MGNTFYLGFEPLLIEWLQNMMSEVGVFIASLFTILGEETVLIVILGFIYWCYNKELAKSIAVSIVVCIVWNPLIKNIALRRRPYMDFQSIKCLTPVNSDGDIYDIAVQGYSFPSGHSCNAGTVYWSLASNEGTGLKKILRVVAIIIPITVGFSRVALGVHYPTDVLGGWIMGLLIVFIIPRLQKAIRTRWKLHLGILLLSIPGVFYCKTNDYFTALGVMIGVFLTIPFEEKYVHFKNTKEPIKVVFRMIGGMGIYLALNLLLKLPFDEAFLASPTRMAFLIRTMRYAIIVFVTMGVYPILFDKFKLFDK